MDTREGCVSHPKSSELASESRWEVRPACIVCLALIRYSATSWPLPPPALQSYSSEAEWRNGTKLLVVGESGLVLDSTDSGTTWIARSTPVGSAFYHVHVRSFNEAWIAGAEGVILKVSTEGGGVVSLLGSTKRSGRGAVLQDVECRE